MNGEEFKISPSAAPLWSQPGSILERVLGWSKTLKDSSTPFWEKMVFEFSHYVAEDKAYLMDREQFDDGRYRVFLHVKWEEAIDKIRSEQPNL